VIIEFRVSNFRSILSEQTLSFLAGTGKNIEKMDHCLHLPEKKSRHLLKTLAVYGPNASGKSNLLKAIKFMINFIGDSHRQDEADLIPVEPFQLSAESRQSPSQFELIFFAPVEGKWVRFQYGFLVDRERVHEEWLYAYPKIRAQRWLHRQFDDEKPWEGSALNGDYRKVAEERTNDNTLFLSKAGGQEKHPQLGPLYRWLKDSVIFMDMSKGIQKFEAGARQAFYEQPAFAALAREVLQKTDTGIDDASVELAPLNEEKVHAVLPGVSAGVKQAVINKMRGIGTFKMEAIHTGTDGGAYPIPFEDESWGTRRLFVLTWALYQSWKGGGLLVVDELEASLHPLLARALLDVFHGLSSEENPSQMVFSTHQTHLLNGGHLRRDQVWFASKSRQGCTTLESLWDYRKPPRKGEAVEKGYLTGRYGAIPFIDEVEWHG